MANQLSTYTHKQFFNAPTIQKAFDDVWKGAGTQFAVSILSVLQGSQSLKSASNESIYAAAMKAAVLNLPIEPSLVVLKRLTTNRHLMKMESYSKQPTTSFLQLNPKLKSI